MILSGQTLFTRTVARNECIIEPFFERSSFASIHYGDMTYGLGPAGYDVRVEFDPYGEREGIVLAPGQFALAATIEHIAMPLDLVGSVRDKSSWARRGLSVFNTVIEPGWNGWLTLELKNNGPFSLKIDRGAPIAQIIFESLDEPTRTPYRGKYQHQGRGPRTAK